MFLTDEELQDLTKKTHKSAQIQVLCHLGVDHKRRPDGSLVVLRSHVENILQDSKAHNKPSSDEVDNISEPNWKYLGNE